MVRLQPFKQLVLEVRLWPSRPRQLSTLAADIGGQQCVSAAASMRVAHPMHGTGAERAGFRGGGRHTKHYHRILSHLLRLSVAPS